MSWQQAAWDAPLAEYERLATQLLRGHAEHAAAALGLFHRYHPRFLEESPNWKQRDLTTADIAAADLTLADARLALARWHGFRDWDALCHYAAGVADSSSDAYRFESAIEAVVSGDLNKLKELLAAHPALAHARSQRVTPSEPPVHRATLLHYIAANGVEGHRQKTPPNAVAVAAALLDGGSDPNALADFYGGQCSTLSLLVSSGHPAHAGLQGVLAELLIDRGAALGPHGEGSWINPLVTALVFGYRETAELLARRGAPIDTLDAAAGLGRMDVAAAVVACADPPTRKRALALAALNGHAALVAMLLSAGADPNQFNPPGLHAHSTPLHQAALAGHIDVVRVLVEHGARLDREDTIWHSTPLGWAQHGQQLPVVDYLRRMGEN